MSNSNCIDQNCTKGCCNTYGNCPSTSSYASSSYKNCKYYYSSSSSTSTQQLSGDQIGIIVGPIVGFVVFIIILVCCIRKCYQKQIEANIKNRQNKQAAVMGIGAANQMAPINLTTQQLGT